MHFQFVMKTVPSLFSYRIGLPCPETFNPADHYIYTTSMVPKHEQEYKERVKGICDAYDVSTYGKCIIIKL